MASNQSKTTIPLHRPGFLEMLFFLVSGIIVSIPIAFFFEPSIGLLRSFFSGLQLEFFALVAVAPIVEEFAKAYPLFYRHGESQRSIMILGSLVGLGFGITEFFEYVLLIDAPIIARIPGVFFHVASAVTIAYGITTKRSALFYLVAVGLHASINLLAYFGQAGVPYALVLTIAYALPVALYRRTSEKMIPF